MARGRWLGGGCRGLCIVVCVVLRRCVSVCVCGAVRVAAVARVSCAGPLGCCVARRVRFADQPRARVKRATTQDNQCGELGIGELGHLREGLRIDEVWRGPLVLELVSPHGGLRLGFARGVAEY